VPRYPTCFACHRLTQDVALAYRLAVAMSMYEELVTKVRSRHVEVGLAFTKLDNLPLLLPRQDLTVCFPEYHGCVVLLGGSAGGGTEWSVDHASVVSVSLRRLLRGEDVCLSEAVLRER